MLFKFARQYLECRSKCTWGRECISFGRLSQMLDFPECRNAEASVLGNGDVLFLVVYFKSKTFQNAGMKEQNSKSYLLEFLNIYFNYKFIVEGLSTQYSINSKKLCKSFILHSCILNILQIQKDSQEKYISIKRKTYFCIPLG